MARLPSDVDLATGLDVVFLGAILFAVTQFARNVVADPGGTPHLLRLSAGAGVPATAPELGLLQRGEAADVAGSAGLGIVEPVWVVLALVALAIPVLGSVWFWLGRPRHDRDEPR